MSPIAIVTGASSGIGRASSIALFKAGFAVALSGRRQAELDETKRLALEAAGSSDREDELLAVVGDISKEDGVSGLFEQVVAKFGRIDLLFNNAGMAAPDPFIEDTPISLFDSMMATNVRACFLTTQYAVKQMKAQTPQGGRIINNGSISAFAPRPNSAPYTMSKHAILGLTKCTQLDGRAFSIACSQIDIGNAVTSLGGVGKAKKQASGHDLVEPGMPVDDVARAVVFMASQSLTTNVANMTIMATNMPFVGRG